MPFPGLCAFHLSLHKTPDTHGVPLCLDIRLNPLNLKCDAPRRIAHWRYCTNYYILFTDYIKNVATSEIYIPQTLKNIHLIDFTCSMGYHIPPLTGSGTFVATSITCVGNARWRAWQFAVCNLAQRGRPSRSSFPEETFNNRNQTARHWPLEYQASPAYAEVRSDTGGAVFIWVAKPHPTWIRGGVRFM